MFIGDVELKTGVMNAACNIAKSPEDVELFAKTRIGAIVVGSITVLERLGNAEPRWFVGNGYALNWFGMPNGGYEYYSEQLPDMVRVAHEADKKLVLSVAGFNANEYGVLAGLAEEKGVDIVELNLGCPNVSENGKQKAIASFDIDYMFEIVRAAQENTTLPVTVKLSPYSNPAELESVAELLARMGVAGVVTSNTFPNSYMSDDEGRSVLADGSGGMSGRALRPIALGQTRAFRALLPKEIAVIGVGGIEKPQHVEKFRLAGASAVQAATLIVREGHGAIDRLIGRE